MILCIYDNTKFSFVLLSKMLPDGLTVCINTHKTLVNINLSLTEHKGSTGEYWPKVVGARSVQKRPRANIPQ